LKDGTVAKGNAAKMLDYDDNAFHYFAITCLVIYLIPGTWFALAEVWRAFVSSGDVGTKPRTAAEREKAEKLKRETTGLARLRRPAFLCNLALLVVCGLIFVYLVRLVMADGQVQAFDPFHILGIEQGAATSEIKKAYRKLSLKYHPGACLVTDVCNLPPRCLPLTTIPSPPPPPPPTTNPNNTRRQT